MRVYKCVEGSIPFIFFFIRGISMNVFFLDECPAKAAEMQCDRHVVKMLLECGQLLSTAHHVCGTGGPYKLTHKNHPSAIWVRESSGNYQWVFEHMRGLSKEYTKRYNKMHKTWREHSNFLSFTPKGITEAPMFHPPQCMPDNCKVEGNTPLAYRVYYNEKADEWDAKGRPMTWKNQCTTV
jgi:hypothetical protein